MSCQITYNNEGKIARVNTPSGEESQLFNQISKLPHLNSLEEAAEIYKNKYKDGVSDEAPLNFISDRGNSFSTFREALIDSDGGDMSIMSADLELLKVSTNTNLETTQGLVNYLIKDNLLAEEMVVDNGENFYKSKGTDVLKQFSNENVIKPLKANIKIHKDGRIEIKDRTAPKKTVVGELLKDALSGTFGAKKGTLSEEDLKNRLFDFLKSIGVEVTTIDNYIEKYKIKNGVDVSAQAVADISNQVIAFREGVIDFNVLTEEVAHFIVEGWNEQEIENLLRNIHKTDSYQEHAQKYREIYQKEYPNQDVENLVRREILGKELAKALQSKFSTEGKTETQTNILRRLYDMLINFFDKITLQDNYREQLDSLTERVEDMLLSKDLRNYINTEQFTNKKFRLYSISQTGNPHYALVRGLQEQERVLIRLGRGSSEQMRQLQEALSKEMEKSTVRDLLNLANRQTRYVIEAINEANRRGKTLSNEENIVFQNLKNVISPSIALLKTSIEKDKGYKTEVSDAENVLKNINDAIGYNQQNDNQILEEIVDRLVRRANRDVKILADGTVVQDDSLKEELMQLIKTAKKDTNSVFSYFGQITHAQDPLLNILSTIISDIHADTEQRFQEEMKDFQNKMREMGMKEEDLNKLVQEDGYVISEYNFSELDEFVRYVRAKAYKDNLQEIISELEQDGRNPDELKVHKSFVGLSDKEFLSRFTERPEISNTILFQKVKTEAQQLQNEGTESFLSDEFIKKQEERLKGLSEDTKKVLRNLSQMRGQVRRSMKKSKNGIPVYSLQNKIDLDSIASQRAVHMSPFTTDGKFKTGLFTSSASNEDSVEISEGEFLNINRDVATTEAVIAFELHKYNQQFVQEIKEKGGFNEGLTDLWLKELVDMESDSEVKREDIISWFNLNTSVGFSNEFFADKAENVTKRFENDEEISDKISRRKDLLARRNALLKQYRDSKNSVNTLVSVMPDDIKNRIAEYTHQIDTLSLAIYNYISKKDNSVNERTFKAAETRPNEAYYDQLEDSNLTTTGEKLEFTMKHMTETNRGKVLEYLEALNGGTKSKRMAALIEQYGESEEGALRYAEGKMLPYYASYAPIALQEFYDKVRNTNEPVSKLVNELAQSKDVRLSVSYEYLDQANDEMLNPNRDKDFKGGVIQPSLTKTPTVFNKTFNFKNKNWDKLDPKLKELQKAYIEFKSKAHEYMDYGEGNVYLIPQVPETRLQQIEGLLKGGAKNRAKEMLDQIVKYRVGDIAEGETDEQGQSLYRSNIRIIPRYFTKKLERQENVSKDIFYSTAMMMQQGILRSNRVGYYSEVSAVMDAISDNSRYSGIGKQAQSTNTYNMARSYIDNGIFGVEDVARARLSVPVIGEVDVTKTVKTIHRWKQNLSLAFNPVVAATSFVTAKSGLVIERFVGQYVDSDSYRKANVLFYKNGFRGKADALQVYSKQEASVIMEHMGLLNLSNRFKDAQSKGRKILGNASYGLHQMADYPIKGEVAYSMLVGHRIFNGKLLSKNDFQRLMSQAGKSKAEIDIQWKDLIPLYDFVDVKDGKFSYKPTLYTQLNTTEEGFKDMERIVISRAKQLAQRVDGTIRDEERTFAQRHYLLRYTMTHRGWLTLAVANRFKGRHLNMQTGLYEEGSYVTLGKMVSRTVESLFRKNPQTLKDIWMNMNQEDKVNMQRLWKEVGVLGAIYALGLAFAGFADDDEDDYSKQALAYLFERVTNETISSQSGIVKELYSSVKEPVVGIQQLLEIPQVHKLLTGDEEVKTGRYHGLTERQRWLIKNIVSVKPAYDLWNAKNLKSQRDSYNHFSGDTDRFNPFAYIITKKEYLEEE